jgi:hypothetical protein
LWLKYDYTGTFEAHITVNAANLAAQEKFCRLCLDLGIKCILIELPQGVMRSQLMTASYHHGKIKDVLLQVQEIARKVSIAGFTVTRFKIEAMVSNSDVPITDDAAQKLPTTNYFEFHVKVILHKCENLSALTEYCCQHNAHLSQNPLKKSIDGQQQRFITMRVYAVGLHTAQARFYTLLTDLKQKQFQLSQPQQEYTVFDSNIHLDDGWFTVLNEKAGGDDND